MVSLKKAEKNDAPTLVVIQFRAALTKTELKSAFTPSAPAIAKVPGLRWKFWTFDETSRSFAGVYLFEGRKAAEDYLRGPVPAELRKDPTVSDVQAQAYDVWEDLSRVTGAPIGPKVQATAAGMPPRRSV